MEKISYNARFRIKQSEKEAQKQLDEKIAEKLQSLTTTDMLFDDVLSDWWDLHKKSIKASTEKTMVYAVDEVKESFAPGIKIKNITAKYAQQYFTDSEDNHIKLKKHKSVLSMVFKYAQDLELIDSNPIQRVRLPKKSSHTKLWSVSKISSLNRAN